MGMYSKLWKLIDAAETGAEIPVRCQAEAARRIIQAVRKEKTKNVALRKKLGMLRQGPLKSRIVVDTTDAQQVTIYFSLEWDGRKL